MKQGIPLNLDWHYPTYQLMPKIGLGSAIASHQSPLMIELFLSKIFENWGHWSEQYLSKI